MGNHSAGIVVGYDGSEHAGIAVDWAAGLAQRRGISLTVLHVADLDIVGATMGALARETDYIERGARQVAENGADRARKTATSVEVMATTSAAGVALSLVEASATADLVVVGTRGHSDLAGAALGSVAFAVTAHAHCPAVVVRGDSTDLPGPHRPVMVGADGSRASDAAVRFAADVAFEASAPLMIVAVYRSAAFQTWSGAAIWSLADTQPPDLPLEAQGDTTFATVLREETEKIAVAASMLATARHPGLQITERVVEGAPVQTLTAGAAGHALLVTGSRGRGAFAGLVLGSVSHGLIHSSPCPVAVVSETYGDAELVSPQARS